MNYFKKGLILHLLFFSMLPFGIAQLTVQGLLHIQNDALLHVQNDIVIQTTDCAIENNGTLAIEGNLEKGVTATLNNNTDGTGNSTVLLTGTATQRIDGNFIGDKGLYNLEIDKAGGMVELSSDIEVTQQLTLHKGKLRTDISSGSQASDYRYEIFVSNPAEDAINGNLTAGYIEGNLRRSVSGMRTYSFPVGLTETELAIIQFTSPANSSEVTATFEDRIVSQTGADVICPNAQTVAINCVMGSWNIQGNGTGDTYNVDLNPGTNLISNCPTATTFFVAKDGQINCPEDVNITDGIQSTGFTNFGVFDIPTGGQSNVECGSPNPVAIYLGSRKTTISWPSVPNAKGYRLQIRFKGMDSWLVTANVRSARVFVHAPADREYEYRILTVCEGSESEYSQVFEWSAFGDGGLISAESRSSKDFIADVIIDEQLTTTFEAFPNPVDDYLQLNYSPNTDDAQLKVYHVNGRQVLGRTLTKDQSYHQVDMQALSEGIYMLTVMEKGKQIQSKRIIKNSNN